MHTRVSNLSLAVIIATSSVVAKAQSRDDTILDVTQAQARLERRMQLRASSATTRTAVPRRESSKFLLARMGTACEIFSRKVQRDPSTANFVKALRELSDTIATLSSDGADWDVRGLRNGLANAVDNAIIVLRTLEDSAADRETIIDQRHKLVDFFSNAVRAVSEGRQATLSPDPLTNAMSADLSAEKLLANIAGAFQRQGVRVSAAEVDADSAIAAQPQNQQLSQSSPSFQRAMQIAAYKATKDASGFFREWRIQLRNEQGEGVLSLYEYSSPIDALRMKQTIAVGDCEFRICQFRIGWDASSELRFNVATALRRVASSAKAVAGGGVPATKDSQ